MWASSSHELQQTDQEKSEKSEPSSVTKQVELFHYTVKGAAEPVLCSDEDPCPERRFKGTIIDREVWEG